MNIGKAQKILRGIKYKPKSYFSIGRSAEAPTVILRFTQPAVDRDNPEKISHIVSADSLDEYYFSKMTTMDFIRYVKQLIIRQEMHEVDEFFVFKEVRLFDPHQAPPVPDGVTMEEFVEYIVDYQELTFSLADNTGLGY